MKFPILHATNLEKTITNNDILQKNWSRTLWKIDKLTMDSPGLYVLAGKNGCGKSTLLRCLLGLVKPTQGEISWFGRPYVTSNDLGYVPEFPIIPPSAKVRHWLSWMVDVPGHDLLKWAGELGRFPTLSVEPFLDVPANRLSKGQLQRVQLWCALAKNPGGVILDEPFSGLDPWAKSELSELVLSILKEGRFVLMSTHEVTKSLREHAKETWLIKDNKVETHVGCALPE